MTRSIIQTFKVRSPEEREAALRVVDQVFRQEKRWVAATDAEIPADLDPEGPMSWFAATVDGLPAGVIRLFYDPPLEMPADWGLELDRDLDLRRAAEGRRFVEIGRFMIVREHRRRMGVALRLMREAVREVVERRYTHFITDVYDGDPHSPLGFHTRVLGFERIGTHRRGELACDHLRILLVLDIARAYTRLRKRRDRVFRELSAGLEDSIRTLPATPPL
jgi:hypothetical protein